MVCDRRRWPLPALGFEQIHHDIQFTWHHQSGNDHDFFDPGAIVNLGVGYRLPFGFRIEAELGYEHYAASGVNPSSTGGVFPNLIGNHLSVQSGGNRDAYTATVNAFYDFPVSGPFVPYAGVGVGAADSVSQTGIFAGPGVPKFTSHGTTVTYAVVLAEIGAPIAIDPRWAIVPSYRYEHGFMTGPLDASILKVGLRYSF